LTDIMSRSELYRKFLLQKRNDWKWWDIWLDNYVNKRPHYNGGASSSSDSSPDKKKFFETYVQLLTDNNIEVVRSTYREEPPRQYNSNMYEGGFTYSNNLPSHTEEQDPGQGDDVFGDESDEDTVSNRNPPSLPVTGPVGRGDGSVAGAANMPPAHHDAAHGALPAAHGSHPAGHAGEPAGAHGAARHGHGAHGHAAHGHGGAPAHGANGDADNLEEV